MQSIARAFRTYIGLSVERDAEVNDIITAHACRHALVHAGGMVDRKLLAQVRDAMPRRIQPVLQEGASIQLSPAELRTVGTSMTGYLNRLTG
jgi:hypothetical protein